tara:strand:+ start:827 stop:2026 length:1200 start_codon:yes stop_codon:yes gene_type:complete
MVSQLRQAVILAGGKGERLKPITDAIPKPMIQFHGKPFLEYLINQLRTQGIEEVILLVGYMAHKIKDYFGDGTSHGVAIKYSYDPVEYETGARLLHAKDLLNAEFLLLYCDNYCPINLEIMVSQYERSQCKSLITVYNNDDMFTKSNVMVDASGYVQLYDPSREMSNLNGVEIGYSITKREIIEQIPNTNVRFEHYMYPLLAAEGSLFAYQTGHRYYSIGSHDRLQNTETFLKPQKAIILDRDGVLNMKAPPAQYVQSWNEFQWIPGALDALHALTKSGYKIIVVTNQPGIARGHMTRSDLDYIHSQMINQANDHGANINHIYYCPHGWNDGCVCRKPQPGMLFEAQRDYHLNLSTTLFIGDDSRDEQAGIAAGCRFQFVTDTTKLIDITNSLMLKGVD